MPSAASLGLGERVRFLAISVDGADARLKSEWKFGGSLARLITLPFSSAILGNDAFGDSGADDNTALGDMADGNQAILPRVAQPTGGSLGGLFSRPGVVGGFSAGFLGAGVLGIVFGGSGVLKVITVPVGTSPQTGSVSVTVGKLTLWTVVPAAIFRPLTSIFC